MWHASAALNRISGYPREIQAPGRRAAGNTCKAIVHRCRPPLADHRAATQASLDDSRVRKLPSLFRLRDRRRRVQTFFPKSPPPLLAQELSAGAFSCARTAKTCCPYFSTLAAPSPAILIKSAGEAGRASATATSVASVKMQ